MRLKTERWKGEAAVGQEDVDALKHVRRSLVEERRASARDAANAHTHNRVERLVSLQAEIEAVDRAIADEERAQLSNSEPGGR